MKIAEVEAILEKGGFSEEILEEFRSALKRVPKDNRCRHCYTTAMTMPRKHNAEAIRLVKIGLEEYCGDWVSEMFSYYNLGRLYETAEDYAEALASYRHAAEAVPEAQKAAYEPEYAAHMLRCELHRSGFCYTEALQCCYDRARAQNDFAQALLYKRFYQAVAEVVIHSHHGEEDKAREARKQALEMLRPNHEGPLTKLLRRHRYTEQTKATKEAVAFLKKS